MHHPLFTIAKILSVKTYVGKQPTMSRARLPWLLVAATVLVALPHVGFSSDPSSSEDVAVDVGGGTRRENPAFAKSLAHLRSENARLETELAALRDEVARTVRGGGPAQQPLGCLHGAWALSHCVLGCALGDWGSWDAREWEAVCVRGGPPLPQLPTDVAPRVCCHSNVCRGLGLPAEPSPAQPVVFITHAAAVCCYLFRRALCAFPTAALCRGHKV